jgi:hypothetical protein
MAAIKTKRSEVALMKRLQKVVDECTAYIGRDELRGWYNTGASSARREQCLLRHQ